MKKILTILLFLAMHFLQAQVVINEIDSDTPSLDDKEFVELKSATPNFNLNGYVLVFFNGSVSGGDKSYLTFDLDGLTTDTNGIIVLGNSALQPFPDYIFSDNLIQNGADAVAIYLGNDVDFPAGTAATKINLIDALVYDTDDADDIVLMDSLNVTTQINENQNVKGTIESIQRKNDGTYEVKTSTPGYPNDGSGIQLIGLTISTNSAQIYEGDMLVVTITASANVTADVTIDLAVENGNFNATDYTSSLSATIPAGSNTTTINIQLLDDAIDEGDELMIIKFLPLPSIYKRINNNLNVRIIDNDYVTQTYGSPINPTYGLVTSTAPSGYYSATNGKSDTQLKKALQDIIADSTIVRTHTYADVISILNEADVSPLNSNMVWLMYVEQERAKFDFQETGGSNTGKWNREHVFPRSRGGFYDIALDTASDGKTIFIKTNADSIRHGNTDCHSLRAEDGPENSSRGNRDYGEYNGPINNKGSWKGDVARSIFYMTTRYNGLSVVAGDPANTMVGQLGDLDSLIVWHRNDPPDDYEMHRNNIVFDWQKNRNPYIDYPELVEYVFGNKIGQIWNEPSSVNLFSINEWKLFPNPSKEFIQVQCVNTCGIITLTSIAGQVLSSINFCNNTSIDISSYPKGIYFITINTEYKNKVQKIIVN